MTCFSVLARLLVDTAAGAVTQDQVLAIVRETPRARLQRVASLAPRVESIVAALLARYEEFLEHSSRSKAELLALFEEPTFASARATEGRAFGDEMFVLIQTLGAEGRAKRLFRHIVV